MSKFKSRFPFYKDDADYTTNANSYYEDLARKAKLIQYLAEKIAGYEVILQTSLEEIEGVLAQVIDKIGEGFNAEIADLLVLWVEDGTLDHIINETLMNKKADRTELQALETALNDTMGLLETTLTTQMETLETATNDAMSNLETATNDAMSNLEQSIETNMTSLNNDLVDKLDHAIKGMDMYMYNLQKRHQANTKSFVTSQGACYVSGEGYNINYAMAFLPTDENYENHGVLINANSNSLITETGGTPLRLGHANGMDFNPETNSFYVSHANQQDAIVGSSADNRVSEVSRNGNTVLRVITPTGIPTGRRVKYVMYDKVSKKQYLGDDYGIYEVDSDLNVLKVIDFSEKYLNYKSWGLAQSGAIHNGYVFLIVGSPWTIAVFDLTGKLLKLHKVPKFTKDGFYTGAHPQDLFFDNDGNLFMTSNTESINLRLDKIYTRIFKMTPFTNEAEEHFLGTHNTKTPNWVYVSPSASSPWNLGTKSNPFHSLDEAITYVQTAQTQQGFQTNIWLNAGIHGGSNISTNGTTVHLEGENGTIVEGLRFYDTNVSLKDFTIKKGAYSYALMLSGSNTYLQNMVIDGLNNVSQGMYVQSGSNVFAVAGEGSNRNSFINMSVGMYVTASQVIGTEYNFGVNALTTPAERSSSGYLPLFTELTPESE